MRLFFSLFEYPQVSVELKRLVPGCDPLNFHNLSVVEAWVFLGRAHSNNQPLRPGKLSFDAAGRIEFFDKFANLEINH
jgi:hypothetical protein